jgi:hypothetical protein
MISLLIFFPVISQAQIFMKKYKRTHALIAYGKYDEALQLFGKITPPKKSNELKQFLYSLGNMETQVFGGKLAGAECSTFEKITIEEQKSELIFNNSFSSGFKQKLNNKYKINDETFASLKKKVQSLSNEACSHPLSQTQEKELLDQALNEISKIPSLEALTRHDDTKFGAEGYNIDFYIADGNFTLHMTIYGSFNSKKVFQGYPPGEYNYAPADTACKLFGDVIRDQIMIKDKIPSKIKMSIRGEADGIPIGGRKYLGEVIGPLQCQCIEISGKRIDIGDNIKNLDLGCIRAHFAKYFFYNGFEMDIPKFKPVNDLIEYTLNTAEYSEENPLHRSIELTIVLENFVDKNIKSVGFSVSIDKSGKLILKRID